MKRTTGRYEKTMAGEEVRAFIPHPLPPKKPALQVDPSMTEDLEAAKASIERLAIAGEMVPSVEWLVYAFVRKEAVLSSQIEGTQATLVDLFAHEAIEADQPPLGSDVDEVCNYLSALTFARSELRRKKGLPLSVRLLNQAHRRLMAGRPGRGAMPGEVRSSQNWVGGTRPGNAIFVPPPPHALGDVLSKFELWMHAKDRMHPLVRCALLHAQFETIHPYLDGNGRIGRLLITLLIEHWGLLSEPLLYLSLFFKRNRDEYYGRLSDIRTEGDWEAWVAYFLEGVRSHSGRNHGNGAPDLRLGESRPRCRTRPSGDNDHCGSPFRGYAEATDRDGRECGETVGLDEADHQQGHYRTRQRRDPG